MAQKPRVSILIPSYNHSVYLAETIASARNQTIGNTEILIIDDGSTDDSVAIIKEMAAADSRIRWWHQPNAGLIATLNRLAGLAAGEFIAQIDSDDVWTPERLAWGLEDMTGDPSLSASFTSYLRITEAGTPTARVSQLTVGHLEHAQLLSRMVVKNAVCACTGFMRRSALQQIGPFARAYSLSHDWDRWLRLSLVGNLLLRDTIGALYREHDSNQSLDVQTTRSQELSIHDQLGETLIAHHKLDAALQMEMYGRAAALAHDTGNSERLVHYLLKKAEIYPLSEHEQVWFLHAILQQKRQTPACSWSYGLRAQKKHFSTENQQRLAHILAYTPPSHNPDPSGDTPARSV